MAIIKACLLLVLVYAIRATATITVFHTNCTLPDSQVNFVAAPNTRGTLEILWSCLFTLFVCTWTVQHLDIPSKEISDLAEFGRKLGWSLVTLVAPEYLTAVALEDFQRARLGVRKMQEVPELVEKGSWTMTHAFYANMGGFILREKAPVGESDPPTFTTTNDYGGPPRPDESDEKLLRPTTTTATTSGTDPRKLDSVQIIKCLQNGLLSSPPKITKRDIQLKAKGDVLLKCITAIQILWFFVQVSARKVLNKPISQLEIAVLAFSVFSIMGYLFWMKKPQDVSVPTYLDATRALSIEDIDELDAIKKREDGSTQRIYVILGGMMIFGAIHLLAWRLRFPTHIEKILWRIAALTLTAFFAAVWLTNQVEFKNISKEHSEHILVAVTLTAVAIYITCRGFIIVETFRSLGYLPAGAFIATWFQSDDPGLGIGGYDLTSPADLAFPFDYDHGGQLDHLVLYRPGTGTISIIKNSNGFFSPVYHQGDPGSGIGGYDLLSPADRAFAFDYDHSGKMDHIVLYRPGRGAIFIVKNLNNGTFLSVFQQGDPGTGIGGYNLQSTADLVFPFDYDHSGKLDHLVLYCPGTGAMSILENSNGSFSPVYPQGDPGSGIGGYDLQSPADRAFAFDYGQSGNMDHIVLYRPGRGAIFIVKNDNGTFSPVVQEGDPGLGIGDYDLSNPNDVAFAFDFDHSRKMDHIALYRPGDGQVSILKNTNGTFLPVYEPKDQGIGGYDLKSTADLAFAYDYDHSGKTDCIVLYRPGKSTISIQKKGFSGVPVNR